MSLVLASGSAARRALLEDAGLPVRVVLPGVDEAAAKREMADAPPDALALRLATAKARAVGTDGLVIGGDQVLVCEGRRFDKPRSMEEARGHLVALRGRAHELVTAVVLVRGGAVVWQHVACPVLTMRAVSDGFLDGYLAREGAALMSTVGAYRLEGLGIQLFDRVEGEHGAILGLPMLPLLAALRGFGVVDS